MNINWVNYGKHEGILQGHGNELPLIIASVNAPISFFPEKCQKINAVSRDILLS